MGSRGAFVNVNIGNFTFVEGGQRYFKIGTLRSNNNVEILMMQGNNVKAPEFSHSANKIYAIVKDGMLKHLAFYDEEHKQAVSIDFAHKHNGVQPHRHVYLRHNKKDPGVPPTKEEVKLIKMIKREFKLK